jgi:hypothetical protein
MQSIHKFVINIKINIYVFIKHNIFFPSGEPAYLMIASDSELRRLNPYKTTEGQQSQLLEKHVFTYKIESIDVLYEGNVPVAVYWTDHHNKCIQRYTLPPTAGNTPRRVKREGPETIVSIFFLITKLSFFRITYLTY